MKLAQRMLTASAVLLFGSLMYACGGGATAGGTLTQADFDKLLGTSSAFTDVQTGLARLPLIGKVKGQVSMDTGLAVAADFGPCADMGIYSGQGGSDSANPLQSQFEIYKQTADTQTGCPGATTSYNETTGFHDRLPFAYWSAPNCKGVMYVSTDTPSFTMSLAALEGILVMKSPDPADDHVYASAAGSSPQTVTIQSNMNGAPGGQVCGNGAASIHGIAMPLNETQTTGVPDSLVPGSWSRVAP